MVATVLILLLLAVIWALLTEGSYLGAGWVRWIYSRVARSYETKWATAAYADPAISDRLFVEPLRRALGSQPDSCLLDLACGTGRLSLIVLKQPWFAGRVRAIDLSADMLSELRSRMDDLPTEAAARLTVEQNSLDNWNVSSGEHHRAIVMAEVGELLPNFETVVEKVAEALEPGGLFLLTKPPDRLAWLFFGRPQTTRRFRRVLAKKGFDAVAIYPWRRRYQVVHAFKGAASRLSTTADVRLG